MPLQTQDFSTIVTNQVTAIQASSDELVDFSTGAILLALVESNAAVVLWLQSLLLTLLATTRASTSTGNDLDTWVNDYGLIRLPAVAASGMVTYSRFTPTLQAVVLVGNQVQTADGQQTFSVVVDENNVNYDASQNGYVLLPGVSSIDVPVVAAVAGSGGNVGIGTINTLLQAIPGVDTVSNNEPFTNGKDVETDDALRNRFIDYINSLSKATVLAVQFAVESVAGVTNYRIVENQDINSNTVYGFFYVMIDDGTGNPPSTLLESVSNAVDQVRPISVRFQVYPPQIVTASVSADIQLSTNSDTTSVMNAAENAISSFINELGIGESLPYTRLAQVIYDASASITNVTHILLNGKTNDLIVLPQEAIKSGNIVITVLT